VLILTKHAARRMAEREVSEQALKQTIPRGDSFKYFHGGVWKTAFYDPATNILVAVKDGQVLTVIADATPQYIDNLKRAKP
jgi:hypothetical protein